MNQIKRKIEACVTNCFKSEDNQTQYYEFTNLTNKEIFVVPCWCLDDFVKFDADLMDENNQHLRIGANVQLYDMGNNKIYPSKIYERKEGVFKKTANKYMSRESLYENTILFQESKYTLEQLWDLFKEKCESLSTDVLVESIRIRDEKEEAQRQFLLSALALISCDILPIQEGKNVEFKSSFVHTAYPVRTNERMNQYRIIFSEIVAFANSHEEGTVYVGINNQGDIQGVEGELLSEVPFSSRADFESDFINQLYLQTQNHAFVSTVKIDWYRTESDKIFSKIYIPQWKGQLILLNGTELFVRNQAGKRQLKYNDLIEYVIHNTMLEEANIPKVSN
ncbi:ATP-binding protein [Bacteroides sp.]|uniref:ATP-binding protein n=1 Tax=Bacteroides sp. TaxID=29523 RepID=UPI00258F0021|nr:ATP-binding protein [Bacteroides sp.]